MSRAVPDAFVALRTRNRLGYLREAVASVRSQSCGGWTLLIGDDASADGTAGFARGLAAADPRVAYVRHDPPLGAAANWRDGFARFEQSAAAFAAHLDDDNRWLPEFLGTMIAALAAEPDAAFAFCDEWLIDAAGVRDATASDANAARFGRAALAGGRIEGAALRSAAVVGAVGINAALIRRDAMLAVGGFRPAAGDHADFDLFLALATLGRPAVYVPRRLVEYRVHPTRDTTTYVSAVGKARSEVDILTAYALDGPAERLRTNRLSIARARLARTLAMAGRLAEARREMYAAWRLRPGRAKAAASLALLALPGPLLRRLLRAKYGRVDPLIDLPGLVSRSPEFEGEGPHPASATSRSASEP